MDQPNTPLPSVPATSFYNGPTAYPSYPIPQQIINPSLIPQHQLRYPHRLGERERQPSLHHQYQPQAFQRVSCEQVGARSSSTRSISRQTGRPEIRSILAASEGHRGTNPCRSSSPTRPSLTGTMHNNAIPRTSTIGSRPARSYIRSWRREVGEAAGGDATDSNDEAPEVPTLVAPMLKQRDSGFSTRASSVTETGEEHTRDVQQDVPLNTFSRAVKRAAKEDGGVDAVRQETIKQERVVEENQTKQQTQEQKKALAEKMVDTVHDLICSTWPSACEFDSPRSGSDSESETSSGEGLTDPAQSGLVPLRAFIREILRRSKSSCATLRCAEWYLLRVRQVLSAVPEDASSSGSSTSSECSEPDLKRLPASSPLLCPRRAFLSALIVAHKFLHDRVYSNRAWAKVSGLDVTEIGKGELALACLLDWKLWVGREEKHDSESGSQEQDETTWFTAVGQQVPIPCKRSLPEQPLDVSPAEIVAQCSSADSSPSHFAASVASTMETAPQLGVPHAGSAFSSTAGSFAFVSPTHWQSRDRDIGRNRSLENSAMTTLSTSMPGLSLGSLDGSSDTSVSPASYVGNDKDGEIHVLVNGEEQFSVQITMSPESFVDQPRVRWNPRKRGSPQEEEGHDLDMTAFTQDGLNSKSVLDIQTGKKRRVSISKSQPTRICGVN